MSASLRAFLKATPVSGADRVGKKAFSLGFSHRALPLEDLRGEAGKIARLLRGGKRSFVPPVGEFFFTSGHPPAVLGSRDGLKHAMISVFPIDLHLPTNFYPKRAGAWRSIAGVCGSVGYAELLIDEKAKKVLLRELQSDFNLKPESDGIRNSGYAAHFYANHFKEYENWHYALVLAIARRALKSGCELFVASPKHALNSSITCKQKNGAGWRNVPVLNEKTAAYYYYDVPRRAAAMLGGSLKKVSTKEAFGSGATNADWALNDGTLRKFVFPRERLILARARA